MDYEAPFCCLPGTVGSMTLPLWSCAMPQRSGSVTEEETLQQGVDAGMCGCGVTYVLFCACYVKCLSWYAMLLCHLCEMHIESVVQCVCVCLYVFVCGVYIVWQLL